MITLPDCGATIAPAAAG